jgi:hypothetical protein
VELYLHLPNIFSWCGIWTKGQLFKNYQHTFTYFFFCIIILLNIIAAIREEEKDERRLEVEVEEDMDMKNKEYGV